MQRTMRVIIILLCASVHLGSYAYALDSKKIDHLLSDSAPGYSLLSENLLSTYAQDYYIENFPNSDPRFVYGDFNGNGCKDYAVLTEKTETKGRYFLILISSQKNGLHIGHKVNLEGFNDVFLSSIEPGNVIKKSLAISSSDDDVAGIELERTSFVLTYFEKAAVAFYWDKEREKVLSVQVSD